LHKQQIGLSIATRYSYNRVESGFTKKFITTQGTLSHINGRYIDINNLSTTTLWDSIATLILNLIMILLFANIAKASRILRQNERNNIVIQNWRSFANHEPCNFGNL
jgi:hypothetical protein